MPSVLFVSIVVSAMPFEAIPETGISMASIKTDIRIDNSFLMCFSYIYFGRSSAFVHTVQRIIQLFAVYSNK